MQMSVGMIMQRKTNGAMNAAAEGLVVRVPGYTMEMYCASCEVRTELIYVMYKKVDRLCGLVVRVPGYRYGGPGSIPGATRFSEK
jgi:hypothetical protein